MAPEPSPLWSQLFGSVATLAGVLISGGLAIVGYYIKTRTDLEKEVRTAHLKRKLEVYEGAYEYAAASYQTGMPIPTIDEVRRIYKGLILVGSSEVIRAFNAIFDSSSEKLRAVGYSAEKIKERQTEVGKTLYAAIRADLYPHQGRLAPEDIRFIEAKDPAKLFAEQMHQLQTSQSPPT